MKKIIIIICLFMPILNFSQTEKEMSKKIAAKYEEYYNADDYQKLFNLFSAGLKEVIPLEKTVDLVKGLKLQVGKIKNREFIAYENGSYATYKTTYERAVLALYISLNVDDEINGLYVKPYKESDLPKIERNETTLILPFKGEWMVFWGGDTKEQNYHVESEAQKNAFDIIIIDENGNSFRNEGTSNEDYYAFGKELFAPCDAEVVTVIDGIKDNIPRETNPIYAPGNTVVLKTINNEYLFFAHFKQHSIVVKQGQMIKQGELLGLCGNSGNSSEAHIHFHIQNTEDMMSGTGIKSFFDQIMVNGELKKDYSPIKGDKIKQE